MIPKKLDKLASTEELIVWLNELRDFLQAKEDPENIIKAYKDLLDRQHEGKTEEASKGECKEYRLSDCIACGKQYLVPKNVMAGAFCDECRKNNPPEHEEDEVEKIINPFIEKWLPDSYPHLVDTDENDGQRLRDKILDNFVSKEKIKNQLLEIEKTFNRIGIVSSLTVRNMIKEVINSLGLGD